MDMSQVEAQFEVVWPLGRSVCKATALAPAILDLNGKTVCELWDWVFRGDQMFPIINRELREQFPGINIVDYQAMGNPRGRDEAEYAAMLPELLRRHGCDAVISAVGA